MSAPTQVLSAVDGTMPVIHGSIFTGNHAQRYGGAALVKSVTGDLDIHDSIFRDNTACQGGAAATFQSASTVRVARCTFARNNAVLLGCSSSDQGGTWSLGDGGAIMHVRRQIYASHIAPALSVPHECAAVLVDPCSAERSTLPSLSAALRAGERLAPEYLGQHIC